MDEITAEYSTEELVSKSVLRCRPYITVACKTDLGRVRENNEDKYEFYLPEDDSGLADRGLVFVVCDGMGGHAAGQIASELAVKTFIDVYLHHPSASPEAAAESAAHAANRFIVDTWRSIHAWKGMGTTLSALCLIQDEAMVVHVGDSRVYRLRDGTLSQLTTDHTWVEEAVRTGMMSREAAETHPHRHALTQAMGSEFGIKPDIMRFDLAVGDQFLLCSDGLTNHVDDAAIQACLKQFSPSEAAWQLVSKAMADGGSDNCTVMLVRVDMMATMEV